MFDLPSFRLGRIFGIPIEINLSWLIIFVLVAFSLAAGVFPAAAHDAPAWLLGLVGIVSAVLFFTSVVLHELGHSLVARAEGIPIRGITLFLLGGVSQLEDEPNSAGKEFVMAIAGPAVSLVLAGLTFVGAVATQAAGAPWWIWAPLGYLAYVNALVGVFNLLPGFPLDGGRVLRSILWAVSGDLLKATKWAALVGQFIGWLMVGGAVIGVVGPWHNTGLIWFALIGWFVASMAGAAYRQQLVKSELQQFVVRDAMTPTPESVPGDITVEQLAHDHFLGGQHSRYPVMLDGQIVGLITLPMVKDVARSDWPYVRVADVADRDLDALVVDADAHVDSTVVRFSEDRPGALLVVAEGRMVGIITRSDVIEILQHRAGAAD